MRLLTLFALMAAFALPGLAEEKPEKPKEPKEKKEKEKKEAPKYKKAPAFKAKGTDGKEYSLKQFEGKIVVLEWGDHNCPWVKRHYKQGTLQALQKKYTAKDVVWLVIASTKEDHRAYLKPEEIDKRNKEYESNPTATLMDADGSIARAYQAKTTPHMYVINKKGGIVYSGAPDDLLETKNKDDLKKNHSHVSEVLDKLLKGESPKAKTTKPYG